VQNELQKVFSRYQGRRDELIPILQDIQDALGYLPAEAMNAAADFLKLPASAVSGVASFYDQLHTAPQGRHSVSVCEGTSCHIRGSAQILRAIEKKFALKPGQTTPDHMFTLERVACFGLCAMSPVVMVDGRLYGNMSPAKVLKLIEKLE